MTESSLPYLRETLLFLALAGILIPLLQRLRINQVLGFLAVGPAAVPAAIIFRLLNFWLLLPPAALGYAWLMRRR